MLLLTSRVVVVLTCAVFFFYDYLAFRKFYVNRLATIGQIISANTTAALAFDNRDDATQMLGALKAESAVARACLYDRNGKIFAVYPANSAADAFPALNKDGFRLAQSTGAGFVPVVQADNARVGTLYIESNPGLLYERFQRYAEIAALVMAVFLPVAYLLSTVLPRRIARPILALTETARTISEGRDYSVRARRTTDDELGRLTDAFTDASVPDEVSRTAGELLYRFLA